MARSLAPLWPEPAPSGTYSPDPATATLTRNPSSFAVWPPSDWTIAISAVGISRGLEVLSAHSHEPLPGVQQALHVVTEVAAYTSLVQENR